MKKQVSTLLSALVFCFTGMAGNCPSMSGDYSVGEGADFSTLTEAIAALQCGGVSGPVTLLLENGYFNEKVVIGEIRGASEFNPVVIDSKTGNNADVVLSTQKSYDAALVFSGSSWVTVTNITIENKNSDYGNVVKLDGVCRNITFKSVNFDGIEHAAGASETAVLYGTSNGTKQNITVEDCDINNGSYGVFFGGTKDQGVAISGSLFYNQTAGGIKLMNEVAPVISNNVVSSAVSSSGFQALALDKCDGSFIISNNIITASNGAAGIALNNCVGQMTNYAAISNNSINVGNRNNVDGILLTGSTDNVVLNFNRVKLNVSTQANGQNYYRNVGNGQNVNMTNNIFYDLVSGGYTIIGNTFKDFFNQLPTQSNPALQVSANGLMFEKVEPVF